MTATMEWHPVFKPPDDVLSTSTKKSRLSDSHPSLNRKKLDASYDFGVWGTTRHSSESLAPFRPPETGVFWKRTVAPFVVERKPRARSIPNFPGFDPARDRNYFDWGRPESGTSAALSMYGSSSSLPRQRAGEAQTLILDAPRSSRSRPTTGQHF
mmetsp:Transcript_9548/g.17081  ORF Transcript_9548/g.17081 Transcript_9548/m.17081 type:complete len:155 (-) Transcript_9548:108-572(-)